MESIDMGEDDYSTFTVNDPEYFSSEVKKLSKAEQLQVLKIILESDNSSYSENSNGSYVSLHVVKDKPTLHKIYKFMKFCEDNRMNLQQMESDMEEQKQIFLSSISDAKKSEDNTAETNNSSAVLLESEKIGEKIVLKRNKIKFSGNKGKLLKSFKSVSKMNKANIKTQVTTKKKKQQQFVDLEQDEEEIDADDDNVSEMDYVDDDEEDDKEIDICEQEAEIEHEEVEGEEEEGEGEGDDDGEEDGEEGFIHEDDDDDDEEEDDEFVEVAGVEDDYDSEPELPSEPEDEPEPVKPAPKKRGRKKKKLV